jgi:hypothetical protein
VKSDRSRKTTKKLLKQLRREAMESRPEFSETLHQRIFAAVQREAASVAPIPNVDPPARRRRLVGAAALTAACGLAIVLFNGRFQHGWQSPTADPAATELQAHVLDLAFPTDSLASMFAPEESGEDVESLDGLIASRIVASKSSALKSDLHTAAESLIERLPVDVELIAGE